MQSTLGLVLYMGFFFALMYFLLVRPQKKKAKQMDELRNSVKKGDKVVTIGGIVGTVAHVKDDDILINVNNGTELSFKKWAISSVEK